jgi:hypothetical protein
MLVHSRRLRKAPDRQKCQAESRCSKNQQTHWRRRCPALPTGAECPVASRERECEGLRGATGLGETGPVR